jgi:hypothetical protein
MNIALDITVDGVTKSTVVFATGQSVGLQIRPHEPAPRPRLAVPASEAPKPDEPCPCGSGRPLAECLPSHTRVDPAPPPLSERGRPARGAREAQGKGARTVGWFRGQAIRALDTVRTALTGEGR